MLKKRIFGLFFLLALHAFPAQAEPGKAVITHLDGQAMVLKGSEKLPATMGMDCVTGNTLSTEGGGTVDISWGGKAGCRVLPSSQVALSDISKTDMAVKIESGNAIFNLDKLPPTTTFRVETPTAIAAVKGTQFWGRVDLQRVENPVTTFAVREGTVEILAKASGKVFNIEKGQALDLPKDGGIPEIRPALEAELQAMEQAASIRTSA